MDKVDINQSTTMVRIGKLFKRKGDHKDGDVGKDGGDGSIMSKGSPKGTQIEETGLTDQDVPVDAADNESIDDATHTSLFAEKTEQREEAPETYPVDLGLSASESDIAFPSQEQNDDGATDDEDAVTMDDIDTQFNTDLSDKSSFATAMEEEVTATYFHKYVVVNCLGDGSNDLVIREMYYIPKPNAKDHVVVKVLLNAIQLCI